MHKPGKFVCARREEQNDAKSLLNGVQELRDILITSRGLKLRQEAAQAAQAVGAKLGNNTGEKLLQLYNDITTRVEHDKITYSSPHQCR